MSCNNTAIQTVDSTAGTLIRIHLDVHRISVSAQQVHPGGQEPIF